MGWFFREFQIKYLFCDKLSQMVKKNKIFLPYSHLMFRIFFPHFCSYYLPPFLSLFLFYWLSFRRSKKIPWRLVLFWIFSYLKVSRVPSFCLSIVLFLLLMVFVLKFPLNQGSVFFIFLYWMSCIHFLYHLFGHGCHILYCLRFRSAIPRNTFILSIGVDLKYSVIGILILFKAKFSFF